LVAQCRFLRNPKTLTITQGTAASIHHLPEPHKPQTPPASNK